MPEESAPTTNTVDLNPQPKKVEFTKTKFWLLIFSLVLLMIVGTVGGFFAGQASKNNEPVIAQRDETKDEEEEKDKEGIKTVEINEEVEVKSGITLILEEAKIDGVYENQKKDQKAYYERNASQSAYLDSEYFTSSNLVLKIVLSNGTKETTSYNPQGFRLKDGKNNQYISGLGEGEKTTIYNLNPGETTKLSLSYIIPETEKSFELIYENAVIEFSI